MSTVTTCSVALLVFMVDIKSMSIFGLFFDAGRLELRSSGFDHSVERRFALQHISSTGCSSETLGSSRDISLDLPDFEFTDEPDEGYWTHSHCDEKQSDEQSPSRIFSIYLIRLEK